MVPSTTAEVPSTPPPPIAQLLHLARHRSGASVPLLPRCFGAHAPYCVKDALGWETSSGTKSIPIAARASFVPPINDGIATMRLEPANETQMRQGGAPPADVVAQLAALTEALAQQQRQHAETMAAMQAQLAAQEARANAAAAKAAADAAQLLANRQAVNAFQTELALLAASPMVTEAWSLQELDVLTEVLVFHGARYLPQFRQ
ncbi:hypothetical protein CYMTET_39359 [Cymbomonas tetramitiformis]|uniref:Uncharacterized protein n=1 Tax=Cymbomonas tetramitiformis TaxID=36881 RepID=A0AAE0CBX4_9CHLO|nr:hypothetical protein CYMTET_39359 [Cymbomonas tetramitiformis]